MIYSAFITAITAFISAVTLLYYVSVRIIQINLVLRSLIRTFVSEIRQIEIWDERLKNTCRR